MIPFLNSKARQVFWLQPTLRRGFLNVSIGDYTSAAAQLVHDNVTNVATYVE